MNYVIIVILVLLICVWWRARGEKLRNPNQQPPQEGEVVRCRCSDAIYLIENGKRRQFVGSAYHQADLPPYRNFVCELNSSVNQRGGVCELIHQIPIGEPIVSWPRVVSMTPR